MGFKLNKQNNKGNNNDDWKARGFLNVYIVVNGERKKLAGIPLKASKPREDNLCTWLEKDPNNINRLLDSFEIEYQAAVPESEDTFGFE